MKCPEKVRKITNKKYVSKEEDKKARKSFRFYVTLLIMNVNIIQK